jgi:hypothetical protein
MDMTRRQVKNGFLGTAEEKISCILVVKKLGGQKMGSTASLLTSLLEKTN